MSTQKPSLAAQRRTGGIYVDLPDPHCRPQTKNAPGPNRVCPLDYGGHVPHRLELPPPDHPFAPCRAGGPAAQPVVPVRNFDLPDSAAASVHPDDKPAAQALLRHRSLGTADPLSVRFSAAAVLLVSLVPGPPPEDIRSAASFRHPGCDDGGGAVRHVPAATVSAPGLPGKAAGCGT